MHFTVSLGVDKHDNLTSQETEGNPSAFTVILTQVFACYGEVVPDRFGADKVQPVGLDIA